MSEMRSDRLRDEVARLKHDIERHVQIAAEQATENEALRDALKSCVVVMDEAGRAAALKELTDAELGKLWLSTVDKSRAALAAREGA